MTVSTKNSGLRGACVITSELLGWGGAAEPAAVMLGFAQSLSAAGEDVTLVWVPNSRPPKMIEEIKASFYKQHSIKLEILQKSDQMIYMLHNAETRSMAIYHYLKENQFKAVYFALEKGLAFYSLLAKETDVFVSRPQLTVVACNPIEWLSEADRFFLKNAQQVSIAVMEKYCVEMADRLICLSSNLLAWFKTRAWRLPKLSEVLPGLMPQQWQFGADFTDRRPPSRIGEIALLAGPDFRDGITLFCDALDELARSGPSDLIVTAFGPFGKILGEHTGGMILRRARRWPFDLQLLPGSKFRECLQYIAERCALAVIPSLDSATGHWVSGCLRLGIPFVATKVGANIDHVPPNIQRHSLALPRAEELATAIAAQIENPVIGFPHQSEMERQESWLALHRKKIQLFTKTLGRRKAPLVSVIVAHHDRPQYLLQVIRSIEDQDYRNLELIVVDDGSKLPESRALLDRLEGQFKGRKWKIIRSENKYVGAARNTGVRASRGEMIIFVDDDNALFRDAVSKFVHSMEASGADICTACHRHFYDSFVPGSERSGFIQYHITGGSPDIGLMHNAFGETTAIYKRSVFDKIGFQLEKRGYMTEDWEFFARAALAGLKIRVIPEPLYWYRASTQGRYRSSHWYDNRLPILAAYRKHKFRGLEHIYQMVLAQNVDQWEMEGYRTNLRFSPSDAKYLELCEEEPNSEKALNLLARIAASEGRPGTAVTILAGISQTAFDGKMHQILDTESPSDSAFKTLSSALTTRRVLTEADLMNFESSSTASASGVPLSYIEGPDRFFLQAEGGSMSFAVLPAGCPGTTVAVSARVSLDQAISEKTEFMILVCAMHEDPILAIETRSAVRSNGVSGWLSVEKPFEQHVVEARLATPSTEPLNLVLAVRPAGDGFKSVLGCFSDIALLSSITNRAARRPRLGPPPHKLRAREWSEEERKSASLLSSYRSELPPLLFPPEGQGIFLRPNQAGPVVAVITDAFPAFARRLIAKVEIAHEEASPFEFAVALGMPATALEWRAAEPKNALAFSGWKRVEERFKLHDIRLGLRQLVGSPLSIGLAIRLPRGSAPTPSNAFWRKIIFMWDE